MRNLAVFVGMCVLAGVAVAAPLPGTPCPVDPNPAQDVLTTANFTYSCPGEEYQNFKLLTGTDPGLVITAASFLSADNSTLDYLTFGTTGKPITSSFTFEYEISDANQVSLLDVAPTGSGVSLNMYVCDQPSANPLCSVSYVAAVSNSPGSEDSGVFALVDPGYIDTFVTVPPGAALTSFAEEFSSPEPFSLALTGSGLLLLMGLRRMRR